MKRELAVSMMSIAGLSASTALADVRIQKTDWADADWATTDYVTGSGGTGSASQTTTGNPDPGRWVSNALNSGTSSLYVFHRLTTTDAVVDPGVIDISSITLSIDALFDAGVGSVGQRIGLALRQGGVDYRTTGFETTGVDKINWVTRTATCTPADFVRMDGLAGSPDFSISGADITFGYYTANTNGTGSGPINQRCNYDNLDILVEGPRIISDTEWTASNWNLTVFETDDGGTATASRSTAQGDPAPSRVVTHTLNYFGPFFPSTVNVFHKKLDASALVEPDGRPTRIASIDFSLDAKYLSGIGGTGQRISVALEQDGVAYHASDILTGSTGDWTSLAGSFTQAAFVRFDGQPGEPNFSTTATPIRLGFRTSNHRAAGTPEYTQRVAYDNLMIRVNHICAADVNADGQIDFSDYLEFLNLFDAQDPTVDFNGDGFVDFGDYLEFLNLFETPC